MKRILLISLLLLLIGSGAFAQNEQSSDLVQWEVFDLENADQKAMTAKGNELIVDAEHALAIASDTSLLYNSCLIELSRYCKELLSPDIGYMIMMHGLNNLQKITEIKDVKGKSLEEMEQVMIFYIDFFLTFAEVGAVSNIANVSDVETLYQKAISSLCDTEKVMRRSIQILDKQAGFMIKKGKFLKALLSYQAAKEVNDEQHFSSQEDYIKFENKRAYCLLMTQQTDKAENLLRELMKTSQIPHNSQTYGFILNNMANVLLTKKEPERAMQLIKRAITIYKTQTPTWTEIARTYALPESFSLLCQSARLFQQQKNPSAASFIYQNLNKIWGQITEKSHMYVNTENILWRVIRPYFNEVLSFAYQQNDAELMYDISQFYNLTFFSYFSRKYTVNIDDDTLVKKTREQLVDLMQSSLDMSLLSDRKTYLPVVRSALLRTNLDNCLTDYVYQNKKMDSYRIPRSWREQADLFSDNEVMVDFITFLHPEKEFETECCAIVFGKKSKRPQIVDICSKQELDSILRMPPKEQLEALSGTLWKPIEQLVNGYSRLYLCLSDEFSHIPFSGIRLGRQYLSDKYTVYTVSSTENINYIKNKKELTADKIQQFSLFGGADFGLPPQKIDNLNRGQGFAYLLGSKQEVDLIADILNGYSKEVTVYSGSKATKQNLSQISSKQKLPGVLHISTHGFLTPYKGGGKKNNSESANAYNRQFDPLLRSGLAFTGANESWKKVNDGALPSEGIMTSLELMALNLWTTELVVLSACHSAKEEGLSVIMNRGLQRAISMTGAHSLLASLWAIPDKESVEMMEEFYRQWLSGITKREAFDKTLLKMRTNYPEEPEKWAGFVLME